MASPESDGTMPALAAARDCSPPGQSQLAGSKCDWSCQTRIRNAKSVDIMDRVTSNLQAELINQACNCPGFRSSKDAIFQEPPLIPLDLTQREKVAQSFEGNS